jgi:hypothetical protein
MKDPGWTAAGCLTVLFIYLAELVIALAAILGIVWAVHWAWIHS